MASNNYYTYAAPQTAYGSPAAAAAAAAAATYTPNQQGYTSGNAPAVAYDTTYQTNTGNAYYQANAANTTNAGAYSIDYDQSKNAAAAYVTNYANTAVAAAAAVATQGTQNQYAASPTPYPIATNYPSTAGYAPVQPQNPGAVSTQGYDAALYSAATMYMAQQTTAARAAVITQTNPVNNNKIQKQPWNRLKRAKVGFKPTTQQLHYCEVCKISCAGAQTYKEHLEGSKHKKKEAASKLTGTAATTQQGRGNANVIKCVLCAVSCTGNDAYAAHIRGSKHQRVLLLHNKLGKPIPEMEVISTTAKTSNGVTKKIYSGTPKMNFVASGELSSANAGAGGVVKAEDASTNDCTVAEQIDDVVEKDCQPIGQEYVDEIRGEDGKLVTFHCKLCDCRFNDPNAKEMHMKGRKHRVQFKLKVDPNLHVEIKPYMQQKLFGKDFKFGKSGWKKGAEMMPNNWFGANNFGAPPNAGFPMHGPNFNQNMLPQMPGNYYMGRRVDSYDDRHVQTKHATILPKDDEVKLMRSVIETVETSLTEIRERLKMKDDKGTEVKVIKGVMRVGHYQKGIMLTGERTIHLVITCECKPTQNTLRDITAQFANSLKGDFSVRADPDHAAVSIMSKDVRIMVSITSPAMREEGASNISTDVLPIGKCLQALAALRHANWFQKKVTGLRHCQALIRVMRAHCQKNVVWAPLDAWPLELFVQKIIESSNGLTLGLGDLFRRLMEAIAGGCLLHGSPGLADLCEKDNPDALEYLTDQQREDITNSAQTALRLIAFRQIHKVLGIDKIIHKKKVERKRPLDDAAVDESTNLITPKREKMDE